MFAIESVGDLQLRREFLERLTTGTAGSCILLARLVFSYNRQLGELALSLTHSFEQGNPFSADRKAV